MDAGRGSIIITPMAPGTQASPETARQNERKLFKMTLYSCFSTFLTLAAHFGTKFWVSNRCVACVIINGKLTESDLRELDQLQRDQLIVASMGILSIVSSSVFLVALIRWLLAIRARRSCLLGDGDMFSG